MEMFGLKIEPTKEDSLYWHEAFISSKLKISKTHILFRINDYVKYERKEGFRNFKHYEFIAKWINPLGSKCFVTQIVTYEVFTDTLIFDLVIKEFEDEVKKRVFEFLNN